jgi:nitrate/nitrite transporter NarK
MNVTNIEGSVAVDAPKRIPNGRWFHIIFPIMTLCIVFIIPLLGLALSLLLSVVFQNEIWLSFSCLVLAGAFLQAAASVFWTIPPLLFTASLAGAARGAINALGNLGGFLGPFLMGWLTDVFGGTDYGVLALVAFLVISVVITTTLPNNSQSDIRKQI